MAFSEVEEELCDDASGQTIITWAPETLLEYSDDLLLGSAEAGLCA